VISAGTIYAKTAAGQDEVKNRKMKLHPKLRTMLILVDGSKPAFMLREEAHSLGADPDFLERLEGLKLIGVVGGARGPAQEDASPPAEAARQLNPVERFQAAQRFMNETAVNALGIKAFFFTLKLERCATVDDLRGLLEAYREAMSKASGPEEAEVLCARVAELLG